MDDGRELRAATRRDAQRRRVRALLQRSAHARNLVLGKHALQRWPVAEIDAMELDNLAASQLLDALQTLGRRVDEAVDNDDVVVCDRRSAPPNNSSSSS